MVGGLVVAEAKWLHALVGMVVDGDGMVVDGEGVVCGGCQWRDGGWIRTVLETLFFHGY